MGPNSYIIWNINNLWLSGAGNVRGIQAFWSSTRLTPVLVIQVLAIFEEKVTLSMIDMPWLSLGMKIRVLKGILHFKVKI